MKKILALLMLLCLFVPACALADDIPIDQIEVTVEIPLVGPVPDGEAVVFETPSDAPYTVTAKPPYWEAGSGDMETVFEGSNIIMAVFSVTPADGYTLTDSTTVTVNGSTAGVGLKGGIDQPSASWFEFVCNPQVNTTINQIALWDVPTGEIGEQATAYAYADEDYTVTGYWLRYDYAAERYVIMAETERFASGGIYQLLLLVKAERGVMLEKFNCELYVNGELIPFEYDNHSGRATYHVRHAANIIDHITLDESDLPKAQLGASFADTDIPISTSTPGCTVTGRWTYIDENGIDHHSGTFESGKVYDLVLEFRPKDGYALSENVNIDIGNSSAYPSPESPSYLSFSLRTSFKPVIQSVELLNLPTASVGSKLAVGTFPVTVPAGAHYYAERAYWTIYNHAEETWEPVDESTNTVQSGKVYCIQVDVYTKDGYDFAEVLTVSAYGTEETLSYNSPDYLYFEKEFSLRGVISQVDMTGYTQPAVGGDASSNLAALSVPAGASYEIIAREWFDVDTGVLAPVFEKGHEYCLRIELEPKEGYEFADDVIVLLSGTAPDDTYSGSNWMEIYKYVSLKEVIHEIRIDNIQAAKLGESSRTDITIPDGVNYDAFAQWQVWNEKRQIWEPFDGVFESGEAYMLAVNALPRDGFRFDSELTRFYANGNKRSDASIHQGGAVDSQVYAFDLIPIDRVEMTIAEPKAGSSVSHQNLKVSCTAGGNHVSTELVYWLIGTPDDSQPFFGTFKKDGQYGVHMELKTAKGYTFAEDTTIVVNGIILPDSHITNDGKLLYFTYFFGMDGIPAYIDLPQTGDTSSLLLWGSTLAIAAGALITLRRKKKA